MKGSFVKKKRPLAAGDRNKDGDLTGSQIKQSLGLFRMFFYKLGETNGKLTLLYIKKIGFTKQRKGYCF